MSEQLRPPFIKAVIEGGRDSQIIDHPVVTALELSELSRNLVKKTASNNDPPHAVADVEHMIYHREARYPAAIALLAQGWEPPDGPSVA